MDRVQRLCRCARRRWRVDRVYVCERWLRVRRRHTIKSQIQVSLFHEFRTHILLSAFVFFSSPSFGWCGLSADADLFSLFFYYDMFASLRSYIAHRTLSRHVFCAVGYSWTRSRLFFNHFWKMRLKRASRNAECGPWGIPADCDIGQFRFHFDPIAYF